jgi:hypothetical protein
MGNKIEKYIDQTSSKVITVEAQGYVHTSYIYISI